MNINQKRAAQVGLFLILTAQLFPPWQFREPDVYGGIHSAESMRGLHYSLVTEVPYRAAFLNTAVLGIEIGLILVLSLLAMVSLTKLNQPAA